MCGVVGILTRRGGIDVERLDPSMRQAVTYLFPKERGLLLLTLLFLTGTVQKRQLEGHALVDVVVIRLQSIHSNCVPACVSCNSAKGDQHPSMLPPSSWIATTLPHVQKYLKTRERAEGMDS